jgi:hypothetical protein
MCMEWTTICARISSVHSSRNLVVTFALALHYQGEEVWGVPDSAKGHYRHIKEWFENNIPFASRPPS